MNHKYSRPRRKISKKPILLFAALALIVGIAAGGTLAWLTSSTKNVVNVFSPSDVKVGLTESEDLDLKMIPGFTIEKDPKVTVEANSEKCYVFVKLEKSDNYSTFLEEYAVIEGDEGWKKLEEGVYYRIADQSESAQEFYVLEGNQVKVKSTVTKADMLTIQDEADRPTLTLTAYACQYYQSNQATDDDPLGTPFNPEDAWANCGK